MASADAASWEGIEERHYEHFALDIQQLMAGYPMYAGQKIEMGLLAEKRRSERLRDVLLRGGAVVWVRAAHTGVAPGAGRTWADVKVLILAARTARALCLNTPTFDDDPAGRGTTAEHLAALLGVPPLNWHRS